MGNIGLKVCRVHITLCVTLIVFSMPGLSCNRNPSGPVNNPHIRRQLQSESLSRQCPPDTTRDLGDAVFVHSSDEDAFFFVHRSVWLNCGAKVEFAISRTGCRADHPGIPDHAEIICLTEVLKIPSDSPCLCCYDLAVEIGGCVKGVFHVSARSFDGDSLLATDAYRFGMLNTY